ncbi:FAU ubiquitin-like and ribosomal protein S30 isoform X1 [Bombus terrestris]|uniref:FAU ubiquitin-like and ribosomal protein S30 isoform X1 n=2 Tax=Bombus terrestris TaxID=30195 RepID=A0A9B0F6A5_BOMTE|nr:FAU ubiquitin-like and ribosomal protein S30 isoform X1 [Bombus terrestris]
MANTDTVNMQLHIRGEHTTLVESHENETIADIKRKIVEAEGAVNTEFNLYCSGVLLENDASVGDLTSNILELTVSLPGGKVHGSLARAGKVKAQTPKVEKQEKSKKKTGRAKRRIQYNRRFVNVVQTYSRRRGPNANTNS